MIEINNTTRYKIPKNRLIETVEKFLEKYKKKDKDVSIAFVSNKKIQEFNKKYRNKDKTTDILSFAGDDDSLGEIIINLNQTGKQAKELGVSPEKELIFILTHGLLHLIGYTDETKKNKKKMIKLGEDFVNELTFYNND